MFQDAVGSTIELLLFCATCNTLACVAVTNSVTVADTVFLDGIWKKYSINPVVNSRCIPKITAIYI